MASTKEPVKVVSHETTTPSGIAIEYQSAPKRLYRVNGIEVPSVTTALGILDKPGLVWWGMTVGVEGVLALYDKGALRPWQDEHGQSHLLVGDESRQPPWTFADKKNVTKALTENKLTTSHARDAAGDRGMTVHAAFEAWVKDGTMPVPEHHSETEQGYVAGLLAFIHDAGELKKTENELMVASAEYGFAGRLDAIGTLGECSLVHKKQTPAGRKPAVRWEPTPGRWMMDLKTSADFYLSQFIQLEGYEPALTESGYEPTIGRMVVRVDSEGGYEARQSHATFDHFLAILGVYNALNDLEGVQK